jgi:hypothetical protein
VQNHTSALLRWRLWTPPIGPCELLHRRFENLIPPSLNTVNTWMRFDVHMNAYPLRGRASSYMTNRSTALSFHATPVPVTPSTIAIPCST